jgi:hypothetical protein
MRPCGGIILENLDDARVVEATELQRFRRSALLFASGASLLADHDGKWVAGVAGEVKIEADTYDGIFAAMKSAGIDPRYALVRHIQENQRTLII